MTDDKRFIDEYDERVADGATDQRIECPNCGGREFIVSELGSFGPRDELGVACADCGTSVAKTAVRSLAGGVHEQLRRSADE